MIRLDMDQGSPEWIKARLGIATASNFDKIITPKTMKLSASSDGYLYQLIAEWMIGASLDSEITQFMQRGIELEDQAVGYYELQRDIATEKVGLLMRDDRMVACSPDRLVGEDGGLEIKCPSPAVHVGYLLEGVSDKYRCQVQGTLWISGRAWWDLLSFHPDLPPALVRIERDEPFINALSAAVESFVERIIDARQEMIRRGWKAAA